jgi:hypothetical protein
MGSLGRFFMLCAGKHKNTPLFCSVYKANQRINALILSLLDIWSVISSRSQGLALPQDFQSD